MQRSRAGSTAAAALASLVLLHTAPAAAQADTLFQLRAGSPTGDRFVVDSGGGFVALGTSDIYAITGPILATGAGTRVLWYPKKAAFRAGIVNGTQWDDSNIGYASVAFGANTRAGAWSFAVGDQAVASGGRSVAMGANTTASFQYSTAMGASTIASGNVSTAMGYLTRAAGAYSTAMGVRARAEHAGSFVWGSSSAAGATPSDSIVSTAAAQFSIRAAGGIRMFTNIGMTTGVTMNAGGSAWNVVSDRARKENFAEVDGEDVLVRLRSVPVTTWNYVAEGRAMRHVGPMAQDWYAAFGLNGDSLTINQGDFDGVNLAAIRALDERTRDMTVLERALGVLRGENARLREDLVVLAGEASELRVRLERIEAQLVGPARQR